MDFSTYDRKRGLVRAIDKAKSKDSLTPVLKRAAIAFGLQHFALMDIPAETATHVTPLVRMTTLPMVFFNHYDNIGLLPTSPLARTARKRETATRQWRLEELEEHGDRARAPKLRRMQRMRMTMGLVFPSSGAIALLFFGERRPLSPEEEADLAIVADHAMARYEELIDDLSKPQVILSTRELEVLRWTAEGKTSSEIGSIVGLSDHTVNAYLANAIRKLDCVNRAQLVAKAIRLKLID